jgi:hypothetical protein
VPDDVSPDDTSAFVQHDVNTHLPASEGPEAGVSSHVSPPLSFVQEHPSFPPEYAPVVFSPERISELQQDAEAQYASRE